MLSYEFAFFFTNFFDDVLFSLRRGVVEDIKAYRTASLSLYLINDAVFALRTFPNANIVLRYAFKHVLAFADIDKLLA